MRNPERTLKQFLKSIDLKKKTQKKTKTPHDPKTDAYSEEEGAGRDEKEAAVTQAHLSTAMSWRW